ncbi:MAG: SPOR domain-containing protein [Ignavibacteriaceae bacterium]|nr:SPOR domain-containing protein [Ignavibacteriaceae bacterium]
MKNILISFFSVILLLIQGCTPTSETVKEQKSEEVYVFDEVPSDSLIKPDENVQYPTLDVNYYVVQIGAFTTKERAEKFREEAKKKLSNEVSVVYSDQVKLYVVQLSPFYTNKMEAEKLRDQLRLIPDYSDAWILTVSK